VPATCQPVAARHDKDAAWKATICDVSRTGLGLVLPRRFEPGTVLFVELSLRGGEERRPLLARVVRAVRQAEGGWLLGCSFASPLGEDELGRLIDLAAGQAAEQPAGRRVVPDVRLEGRVGGRVARFVVRQLVLTAAWPPAAGTVVGLRLPGSGDIRLRVLGCADEGGAWVLAYEPADPAAAEALRLLAAGATRSASRLR
jgi:hypothetical protein